MFEIINTMMVLGVKILECKTKNSSKSFYYINSSIYMFWLYMCQSVPYFFIKSYFLLLETYYLA